MTIIISKIGRRRRAERLDIEPDRGLIFRQGLKHQINVRISREGKKGSVNRITKLFRISLRVSEGGRENDLIGEKDLGPDSRIGI